MDLLNDPRFPERPDHPDFWKLSEAVLWADGESEEGQRDITKIVSQFIDPSSLIYVALQRAARPAAMAGRSPSDKELALGMACWLDGFIAGRRTGAANGQVE